MSGKLLDTNVVINGIKGIDSARKFLLKFENEYRVSSVTLGELLFGAEKSRLSATNKNTYLSFCNFVGVIDIDSKIAQSYGKIKNSVFQKGKPIHENDIWIAATAIAKEMTLASYDKHFENVDGLDFIHLEIEK